MRIGLGTILLTLGIAACSAERAVEPTPVPAEPHANASLILANTGATPLYNSNATAINDSGVIVGTAQMALFDHPQAAEWRPPDYHLTLLPDLGGGMSVASAISNDGTIGGRVCDTADFDSPCHPVYWRSGALHQLGGIGQVNDVCQCDGHTLVGREVIDGHEHPVLWVDDLLIDIGTPDGYVDGELRAVAHGNIVGRAYFNTANTATNITSYRWSPASGWTVLGAELTVLDVNSRGSAVSGRDIIWLDGSNTPSPLGGEGFPSAVNDSNVVAGSCVVDPGTSTDVLPCEWTSALGWQAIGIQLFAGVEGINNSNEAVGEFFSEGRSFAVLWTP